MHERRNPFVFWQSEGLGQAWRVGEAENVAAAEPVGPGELFLFTPNPPLTGSMIDLLFHVETGRTEIRARATVCHATPGTGRGVTVLNMRHEDRSRVADLLKLQVPPVENS